MDGDDFDDLLCGVDIIQGSYQESLTSAATNRTLWESDVDTTSVRHSAVANTIDHRDDPSQKTSRDMEPVRGPIQSPQDPTHEFSLRRLATPASTVLSATHLRQNVINRIESIFDSITHALRTNQTQLSIWLKTRSNRTAQVLPNVDASSSRSIAVKERQISFPGKTAEEAWRFAVVIRILELVHEALCSDLTLSKRAIFYRDPALFGKQAHVDRYIDNIALTFGVPRSSLNVAAVAKGLIVGAVTFHRTDGSTLNAASDRKGMLVPSLKELLSADMTEVRWILVVEKEATFRSIVASSLWTQLSIRGAIITGKGYPDIATRALLRFLSTPSPRNGFASPPVHGLADFDPDGVAILSTYKCGSISLAHETNDLQVPQLQWLGLRNEHLMFAIVEATQGDQALVMLSARDRRKARKMLEQSEKSNEFASTVRRELQGMLLMSLKAELQALDALPNGMVELLQKVLGK